MALLDYAMLAEYARVDAAGLVTIVGGSFDRVQAAGPNVGQQIYLAARVLLQEDEQRATIEVRVEAPDGQYELSMSSVAERSEESLPVDGRHSITVTVGLVAPLPVAGRYSVKVFVEGQLARELPFIVELTGQATQ